MFIFNGVSSEDMDLVVSKLPPIEILQKEVEEVDLEGKDGSYTVVKNYKTTTKPIEVHYEGNNWDSLSYWLQGNGDLILGNLSDRYYKAYIKGSIPLEQIIKNKLSKFIISFVCQPFGYMLDNQVITLKGGNNTFNNFGTVPCEPIFYINGTGNISIRIKNQNGNDKTYEFKNVNGYLTVNSQIKSCYKDRDNQSYKLKGNYPIIYPFINDIIVTGNVSRIDILPNMRYLI